MDSSPPENPRMEESSRYKWVKHINIFSEYCTSRAVPSLSASGYLNTVGSKLLTDVHVLWTGKLSRIYDPPHDKTNKVACAPSEDSDQPGHSPSLISLHSALRGYLRTQAFFMRTAKTDQTGRMPIRPG